jgi:hypothetical protein
MSVNHGVVVTRAGEAPALRLLGEGRPKLPSLLDAMRNSLVESSIMACRGVDATEEVGNELEILKVNSFTEGESTARQMFTVDSDGDHR